MSPKTNASKRRWWVTLVSVATFASASGCMDGTIGTEFREAAGANLQTGLLAVADGLINGAFAVFDMGTTSDSN